MFLQDKKTRGLVLNRENKDTDDIGIWKRLRPKVLLYLRLRIECYVKPVGSFGWPAVFG